MALVVGGKYIGGQGVTTPVAGAGAEVEIYLHEGNLELGIEINPSRLLSFLPPFLTPATRVT